MIKLIQSMAIISSIFMSHLLSAEAPSSRTITENFKDWQLACVEQNDIKRCKVSQTLVNENKAVVSILSVIKQKDNLLMEITLPHLLNLQVPAKIYVDEQLINSFAYNFCNQNACYIIIEDNAKLFESFRKGKSAYMKMQAIGNRDLKFNFSLLGFSSALNALDKKKS
ncbi:MAG: invasion associated locus B family protein [Gammaproteobacteria bacterium]|nr:invasion associated locus B family protein [Gammaproteobacteria bacterium]